MGLRGPQQMRAMLARSAALQLRVYFLIGGQGFALDVPGMAACNHDMTHMAASNTGHRP